MQIPYFTLIIMALTLLFDFFADRAAWPWYRQSSDMFLLLALGVWTVVTLTTCTIGEEGNFFCWLSLAGLATITAVGIFHKDSISGATAAQVAK